MTDRSAGPYGYPCVSVQSVRIRAMLRAALLAAVALVLTPAAAQAADVRIYFTKGEQLAYVERDLPAGVEPALRSLLAGSSSRTRAA